MKAGFGLVAEALAAPVAGGADRATPRCDVTACSGHPRRRPRKPEREIIRREREREGDGGREGVWEGEKLTEGYMKR